MNLSKAIISQGVSGGAKSNGLPVDNSLRHKILELCKNALHLNTVSLRSMRPGESSLADELLSRY